MSLRTTPSKPSGDRVLRMRELSRRLQLSPSRLYALIAEGRFLPPFRLVSGGRAVGWLESEVDEWLSSRRAGIEPETDESQLEVKKYIDTKNNCRTTSEDESNGGAN